MEQDSCPRLAILYPGDRAARERSDPTQSRFAALFEAFEKAGIAAEPAIYSDDFRDEVFQQLMGVRGVLVWHNPIEGGHDRRHLDAMLRKAAAQGVFVSTRHQLQMMRLSKIKHQTDRLNYSSSFLFDDDHQNTAR
jgi:hypothetical protein